MRIDERRGRIEKIVNKSLFPTHGRKAGINIMVNCDHIPWI